MRLERGITETRVLRAPSWFYEYLARHLSVPVEPGTTEDQFRFGMHWNHQADDGTWQRYGSLVKHDVVPAGLTSHVIALARHYGLRGQLHDIRVRPEEMLPLWSVQAKWRPYQDEVHKACTRRSTGVIDAPPRSGKTLMAARIIDTHNLPTVYIAPSVQIVRQVFGVLREQFGSDFVSRLDGSAKASDKDPEKQFVVTTPQSAVNMSAEWWAGRKVLALDEFHHAAADTYHRISALAVNAYYRYCFTGTHFRTGDDGLAMEAICSTVLKKISVGYLVENGWLAPPRVFFRPVRGTSYGSGFKSIYDQGIVGHEERNDLVVRTSLELLERGVPTIVLVRRRNHADALGSRIDDSVVVKGGENALTSRAVQEFNEGRHNCLIGTSVIGEGVDVPRAAALVYACGGREGVMMMQSYFRPLTANEGKDCGRIYDFVDHQNRLLRRHSSQRMAMVRDQLGSSVLHTE